MFGGLKNVAKSIAVSFGLASVAGYWIRGRQYGDVVYDFPSPGARHRTYARIH